MYLHIGGKAAISVGGTGKTLLIYLVTPLCKILVGFNPGVVSPEVAVGRRGKHYRLLVGQTFFRDSGRTSVNRSLKGAAVPVWLLIPEIESLRHQYLIDQHSVDIYLQ